MMELLRNLYGAMRAGWLQYAEGMYIGVFLVAILFLWLVCHDKFTQNEKKLFGYVPVITILVLCPVSAFFLLKYQTAFFTYSQLFLLLPMTLVIAWAFTEAVTVVSEKQKSKPAEIAAVFVAAFILFMAGTVSPAAVPTNETENSVKVPGTVKEVLEYLCGAEADLSQEIILAPDEVLQYARAYSADFRLLYGRNMWQKELNAYTYDTYAPELEEVHAWLNPKEWEESVLSDNLTPNRALEVMELFGTSILVLTQEQFADEELKAALVETGYKETARTTEYIIIDLR